MLAGSLYFPLSLSRSCLLFKYSATALARRVARRHQVGGLNFLRRPLPLSVLCFLLCSFFCVLVVIPPTRSLPLRTTSGERKETLRCPRDRHAFIYFCCLCEQDNFFVILVPARAHALPLLSVSEPTKWTSLSPRWCPICCLCLCTAIHLCAPTARILFFSYSWRGRGP